MPFSKPEDKRAWGKEKRREAVEEKLYFCTGCEHAFQTLFGLEKHGKGHSCLALITNTIPTPASVPGTVSAVPGTVSTVEHEGRECLPAILPPAPVDMPPTLVPEAVPPVHVAGTVPNTPVVSAEPIGVQEGIASLHYLYGLF